MHFILKELYNKDKSFPALLLANSVPFIGVLFFDWSLFSVIFMYWLENVAVGIFNIARMRKAEGQLANPQEFLLNGKPYDQSMKNQLIGFFCFHYGIFTAVHGAVIFQMFGPTAVTPVLIAYSFIPLFLSHYISYRTNFIGKEEYKKVSPVELFIQPYKRVVVLHLTILGGGAVAQALGAPVMALVVLIALKTFIDTIAHFIEHQKLSKDKNAVVISEI